MKTQDLHFIHPEDNNNIHYWTKKWNVSTRQLYDAILYTGSLNADSLKSYLKKDNWFYHPAKAFRKVFTAAVSVFF